MNLDEIIIKNKGEYVISFYGNGFNMFNVTLLVPDGITQNLKDIYNIFYDELENTNKIKQYIKMKTFSNKRYLYKFCNKHITYEIARSF